MNPLPQHGFVDANTVARHIGMTASYVRQHAAELGAHRFGTAIRFDARRVHAWINERRVQTAEPARRRRPGPKPGVGVIPANVKDW